MRRFALVLAAAPGLLLAAACNRDASDEPIALVEDACGSTVPVRLAAPPEGWKPGRYDAYWGVESHGDHLIYHWTPGSNAYRNYAIARCGGPVHEFALPKYSQLFSATTPAGPRLYAYNIGASQVYLVDRTDEPGLDIPRTIGGFPEARAWDGGELNGRMVMRVGPYPARPFIGAAGLGAQTFSYDYHDGEPLGALQHLGDDIITVFAGDPDAPWLVLFDSGELRRIDLDSGEDTLVQADVRYAQLGPDGRALVWQELGDGAEEPVYLRDLETGDDVPIALNNFVPLSWGQSPDGVYAGWWAWTPDARLLGLVGPQGTLLTVVRADSGEPVPVPEHEAFRDTGAGLFHLTRLDSQQRIDALWDPATDARFEFHRGGKDRTARVARVTDAAIEYDLRPVDEAQRERSLWRIDRATGERVELLSAYIPTNVDPLPDGRLLTLAVFDDVRRDLLLADLETGEQVLLARGVNPWFHVDPQRGVYYLDTQGDEPGLWFAPFPPR